MKMGIKKTVGADDTCNENSYEDWCNLTMTGTMKAVGKTRTMV